MYLLKRTRVRILFDSNKIVLTKNDVCAGKGYYNQGLLILTIYEINNNNNSASYFAYLVDSYDI